ncbi:4'-phosphopantetheinyl transferase family protein [Streptomyces sp. NPDC001985]|uniref:4'-phosphopantetheinyl transferase family protein n=1 Tax=Streptomyces sp. NPDC001985 TaxID=3154406 RepID=UPI00331A4F93
MIDRILPPSVASAWALDDTGTIALFPQEEAAIVRAVEKRRREFTTVRACARRALARLGLPEAPLVPGVRGAPVWPAGVTGSMTHCAGYRAAALARTTDLAAVGIDAEPHDTLPDGVLEAVARPEERAWIAEGGAGPGVCWDRLLFSAKETVFKVWYPLTGKELGFEEATLVFHPGGTFTARLLVPVPATAHPLPAELPGRWTVADGIALTAAVLPAPAGGSHPRRTTGAGHAG